MPFQNRTAATMAITAAMLLVLPAACCARLLHGVASATAVSTGGTATSVSQSLGDSEVVTAAIATNGGDATATQSADSGKHTQVTVADGSNGGTWTTNTHDGKTSSWNDVPACKTRPSRINSVKDGSGRLWGYEDSTSCAYKDPRDHQPLFYWEAAPACPGSPGADSVTDSQGRVWGWAHGASCAYKESHLRNLMSRRQLAQSAGLGGNNDPESTQDDPPTAQPDRFNATVAAQYHSHAWAHSWSTATSWHWSSTGGNLTQEVHAEAETDAYSNNGTAMANATTHAAINGTTADASADSDTTGDLTTAAANIITTQATKPTAHRLLQPVHTVMPLGQNGVPLTTTPEVFQNVPPLSTAADIPPQANTTSSPSPGAAPNTNSNSNAPNPAPVGADLPSTTLDISAKRVSSNASTAVKAASTPAPHSSPVPSLPAPKKVNATSPGLQHSGSHKFKDMTAVGVGAAGSNSTVNVINNTADSVVTTPVSVQNSTAGSGDKAVQCQTVTNIYGQKSLKCEKVAVYSPVKPLAANMVGNTTWQAAEWDDSMNSHNSPVASSPSPQAFPVSTTTPGGVSNDVPASSAGSLSGNFTTAPVPSPSPAGAHSSSKDKMAGPAAVSADIKPMGADQQVAPSSGSLTAPQLGSQVSQSSSAGSIVISPVIKPVISPVISPQIIITINPSAGSNATAAAVPTALTANVTATEATQSTANGPVTVEYSPAESNTSSAGDATDDVKSSAAEAPVNPTSEPQESGAATTTHETTQSTAQASPEPAVAEVAASPEVPAPLAAANPSTPAASVAVSTSAPTWGTAPACTASPTKDTSVQDTLGQLWWSESGVSCAHRDAATGHPIYYTGYQSVTWESAPDCDYAATSTNTMPDTKGRAWGWQQRNSRSCKFVTESGAAVMHQSLVARTS